ncbi:Eco57I restriction-modification methylase domain-containing protein [Haloimpatiens sp. FM7330]
MIKIIDEIYKIIFQPIDIMYKIQAINNYKSKLNIDKSVEFSKIYSKYIQKNKIKGVVYTPKEIANFIIKNTINEEDVVNNPYIKIVDPACGCGNIIIPCFNYIRKIYMKNLKQINSKFNLNLKEDNINKHIIENNLYGFDVDELALKILTIDLFCCSGQSNNNFFKKDFLLGDVDSKFDIFIANPPYIGKKSINKDYSKKLKNVYKDIYKDKSDLSYCFFQSALSKINKSGKLGFITSRYFLESPSGEELRKVLKEICSIYKIVDFYGIRPFKNVGIDPVIIFLSNERLSNYDIEVIKPMQNKHRGKKEFYNSLFLSMGKEYNKFYLNKNLLNNKGWILRDEKERNIINKIEEKSFTNLRNICDSYQGIITGCDKAFVVNKKDIQNEKLEQDIIRPWIKSSYIQKNLVKKYDNYLIYSDFIHDVEKYPNSIKHIEEYKDKLMNRRECIRGVRKWYQLQWGRVHSIFESKKIVFPYKSNKNRFALDKGSFFSADVYCLILNKNVPFTYEYLLFLLNSKVYEFYFKTFAKKLGEDLYEYYPNNLMKLCIPTMFDFHNDEMELYKFFELDEEEIRIIKENTKD